MVDLRHVVVIQAPHTPARPQTRVRRPQMQSLLESGRSFDRVVEETTCPLYRKNLTDACYILCHMEQDVLKQFYDTEDFRSSILRLATTDNSFLTAFLLGGGRQSIGGDFEACGLLRSQ
jgi:hypothetical protein